MHTLDRRAHRGAWLLRALTAAMVVAAVVLLWKKFHRTAEQDELTRYATLTVPAFLDEVARAEALLDQLTGRPTGKPALKPAEARALLVDELGPLLVRMRDRAEHIGAESASVRASNRDYLAAVARYVEVERAAVAAIDDAGLPPEEGYRRLREGRAAAEEAVRAWLRGLRTGCERAGLRLQMPEF